MHSAKHAGDSPQRALCVSVCPSPATRCQFFQSCVVKFFEPVLGFMVVVGLVSAAQWLCVQFLAIRCHTHGLFGFVWNFLTLGSPICTAVNEVQVALVRHYIGIWNTAATLCAGWLIKRMVT